MKKLMSLALSVSAAVLMTACGGGDDGPATGSPNTSTSAAAKYVGTWVGCYPHGSNASSRETLVFTQQGDGLSAVSTETDFAAPSCAGAAGASKTSTATGVFNGTKTIGADTVDKVIITEAGKPSQKQVLLVKGTALFFGKQAGDGGTLDADGYPTTLESQTATKQ